MTQQSPDPLRDPARAPALAGVERAAAKIADILAPTPLLPLDVDGVTVWRSEEHTSELQSLMRISYAVFCLKKKHNHKSDNETQSGHTPPEPLHLLNR